MGVCRDVLGETAAARSVLVLRGRERLQYTDLRIRLQTSSRRRR